MKYNIKIKTLSWNRQGSRALDMCLIHRATFTKLIISQIARRRKETKKETEKDRKKGGEGGREEDKEY